jgi:hypothetical protein
MLLLSSDPYFGVRTQDGRYRNEVDKRRVCQRRLVEDRFPLSQHVELSLEHYTMCFTHCLLDLWHQFLEQSDRDLVSRDCFLKLFMVFKNKSTHDQGIEGNHAFRNVGTEGRVRERPAILR